MEAFDLCIYLLIVFRQQWHELFDDHHGGQDNVCLCAVNLLALPLDPTEFLTDHLRPVPEPFSAGRVLSVELWVVPT
jgi:hypothetical protein